jgi:hypothetical protein
MIDEIKLLEQMEHIQKLLENSLREVGAIIEEKEHLLAEFEEMHEAPF